MITVYSTKTCAWCVQVTRYLELKKIVFQKVFIDDDVETRQTLLDKTGMTSVPVTTDGQTYVVGWNAEALSKLITT